MHRYQSKYDCGKGVRFVLDRGEEGDRYGTERERYNGKGGGKVFMWYTRAVFNNYLARMGVS